MIFSDDTHNTNQENAQPETSSKQDTELATCREALAQSTEKYVYLVAEFENFKRRTEREKAQWIAQAQTRLILDLLPIIDDFERAFSELNQKQLPAELTAYFSGFELIARALQKFLSTHNIEEITDLKQFDPEKHEAIMQVVSESHASGDIVSVLQKGYVLKGHVLRPARVSVAQ